MANVIVVVGSSKGFGRSILEALLSNNLICGTDQHSIFILLTTSKEKSLQTWNEITGKLSVGLNGPTHRVDVMVEEVDLSSDSGCQRATETMYRLLNAFDGRIRQFYAFMNAGSVNPVGSLMSDQMDSFASDDRGSRDIPSFHDALTRHCSLNFTSFAVLLRCFANFAAVNLRTNSATRVRLVNVSSLAAVKPLYGLSVYCSLKAARDMLINNLALEVHREFPSSDFRVLSYAPGPMLTELVQVDLLADNACDNELKKYRGDFVDPLLSATKCVNLLTSPELLHEWKSGDHIDYFDDIGNTTVAQ